MGAQQVGPWVTKRQAAAYIHVRQETFQRMVNAHLVRTVRPPARRVGAAHDGMELVDTRELDELLRGNPTDAMEDSDAVALVERYRMEGETR